ncbi:RagB/SusD family nutrient uptake outer membrane protein [Filimonas effusa]|uniref:RagB/SusD family nutrient uptake outer membrane protein n=1 Tax=Filimonas effusa TaxID=2508721 RepID=A0A4Q1DDP5_9BACT|nr:RagB/SusD family nutrient uptake outer membrane protein [Filimonas effusa]RXK87005.1 RagB/SusD family nutrient uptake outer membrane protein [Filimonas effusa]
MMKLYKSIIQQVLLLFLLTYLWSCKKYLDESPDKSLVIPTKFNELQGILDLNSMYINYPWAGELANDNIYFSYTDWASITNVNDQNTYIWNPNTDLSQSWTLTYARILNANIVLSVIDKLQDNTATIADRNAVKGGALFYRAYNFYELAQLFSPAYSVSSMNLPLGIPLKLSADAEDVTKRSTVAETYNQIIRDLKMAIPLLPAYQSVATNRTRACQAAAFGLLARTYLSMSDYENAGTYADSCLRLYNTLIDYNNSSLVNSTANVPFQKFNGEVIFHAVSYQVNATKSKVDSTLYSWYDSNDIRKKAFFMTITDGGFRFKGNYNGTSYSLPFCGIATDEVYLVRAECYARQGKVSEAMNDLNKLLNTRWLSNKFIPITTSDPQQALAIILRERRKELCFRPSLRWTDIRRLNLSGDNSITITRNLNGRIYTLLPNDLTYTFLIPNVVIDMSGIEQNPR